jgi:YidC/Oxa1 family membrane protein insertase
MDGLTQLWQGLLNGLGSLLAFFYDVIPNYGVAIILLTVAVKLVTLPLSIKSTRSMQAMQKLQPEMKRVQAKYKGDRQKMNEEVMKLYQEHGVNPMGGCFPLLLQMPVLFALFQVFQKCGARLGKGAACPPNQIGVAYLPRTSALRAAITGSQAGFLGMQLGLSPLQAFRGGGLISSLPYFLLIAFMAFTAWYQQKQMTASQSTPQPPQAQMMARLFVFLFPLLAINWPIALTVYWATQNVLTIAQQYLLIGGGAGKAGGWLARLPRPLGPRAPVAADGSEQPRSGANSPPAKHKGSGSKKGSKRR